jgi:uncharacterized repeat protein (TIGR01451 family)
MVLLAGCLLALVAGTLFLRTRSGVASAKTAAPQAASAEAIRTVQAAFGQLPMAFEPNLGQSDQRVKYVARGGGYGLALTANEAVLNLHAGKTDSEISMRLEDAASSPKVTGLDLLPGHSNYLRGNDASKWVRNVPQYARVRYEQVYPGIDLVYYGKRGRVEYDFVLAPGADPDQIKVSFDGVSELTVGHDGNLELATDGGKLELLPPQVYQVVNGEHRSVEGSYVLAAGNRVGVKLGDYDRSRELVIDPVLSYSTYLGGSGDELAPQVAVDAGFNVYVAGSTTSTDFPATSGVFQSSNKGGTDVFVAKLNPSGSALIYATYLGGSLNDAATGVAVDSGFNAYVAGTTNSGDFPTSTTAYQTAPTAPGSHVFLSKLGPAGADLPYSTYLSGSSTDTATGLAIDSTGHAYLTGSTLSTDFPTTSTTYRCGVSGVSACTGFPAGVNTQFFITEVDPSQSGSASLIASTWFGGTAAGNWIANGGGITLDAGGNIYVTGGTTFTGLAANAFTGGDHLQGGEDAFVAKFPHTLSTIVYFTYLGGTNDDIGTSIAVDSANNAYITGITASSNVALPTGITLTPYQAASGGGTDAFIAKINAPSTGNVNLVYFTYLGGSGTDQGLQIAVDTTQSIYVTGGTDSANFPILNPLAGHGTIAGGTDAFLTKLDINGKALYSTYLGGSGNDRGTGITLDALSNAYIVGETHSSNFPTASPAYGTLNGPSDAFVTKIGGIADLSLTVAPSLNPVGAGNQVTFVYTVTNNGPDAASGVVFSDILSDANSTFVSASASPGTCTTPSGTPPTLTCSLSTLASGGSAIVNVVLTPRGPGNISNGGSVIGATNGSFDPNSSNNVASASVGVVDFSIAITSPGNATQTVTAGKGTTYTVSVAPVPSTSKFPNTIGLTCTNLPTGATCAFSTQSIPAFTNSSPVTSTLTLNTTAPPKSGALRPAPRVWYATWLPISGLALLGVGGLSRRRRLVMFGGALVLCGMIAFQVACGSKGSTTTGGTPPGNYTITVTGTSGTFTHSTTVTLIVQ